MPEEKEVRVTAIASDADLRYVYLTLVSCGLESHVAYAANVSIASHLN